MILDRLNPRFICDAYVDLLTTTQGIFAVNLWLVTAVLAVDTSLANCSADKSRIDNVSNYGYSRISSLRMARNRAPI